MCKTDRKEMEMTSSISTLLRPAFLIGFLWISFCVAAEPSQLESKSVTALMRQMTGAWEVESRMWPGPDAKPIDLPPARARRELIRDSFLHEVMEPQGKAAEAAFTRTAHLTYNALNQQYEHFTIDSRLPQMMTYVTPGANKVRDGKVELTGSTSFVAPEWGTRKNVPFMYRLTMSPIQADSQVVQLFLTEQNGEGKEFLAFEYVYRR
jgi:hypothetical protein